MLGENSAFCLSWERIYSSSMSWIESFGNFLSLFGNSLIGSLDEVKFTSLLFLRLISVRWSLFFDTSYFRYIHSYDSCLVNQENFRVCRSSRSSLRILVHMMFPVSWLRIPSTGLNEFSIETANLHSLQVIFTLESDLLSSTLPFQWLLQSAIVS